MIGADPTAPSAVAIDPLTDRVPPTQAYLASVGAEVASVTLFAIAGGLLAAAPGATPPALLVGVGATLVGLAAQGVERGEARRLTWPGAAALAALAAGVLVAVVLLVASAPPPPHIIGGAAALVLGVGPALARWASRFDRQEAGWREVVRQGPPTGSSPLADRIAAASLPRPVMGLLLPVSLLLRIPCLLAILGYQLTFSRLMPPACRYEPTCSRYGFEAYLRLGVVRGSLLTALRLLRCSPIGSGGYDPMPPCAGGPHHDHRAGGGVQ